MAPTPKVFGIGLRKSGTRSVAAATRELGFRTLHKGGRPSAEPVERARAEGLPLLTYLGEQYDVYFDVEPLVHAYRELDEQYPGSRFILTRRDIEPWLASYERHVLANQERAARGEYDGDLLVVETEAWRAQWHQHHAEVRAYFADRPDDLLEFDLSAGDGWEVLAPFLGVAVPTKPFPWENKEGEGTYRGFGMSARARGLVRAGRSRLRRTFR